jgi:hypothetical protein
LGRCVVEIEHALFGGVEQDRDHHLVKLQRGTFEHVDVTQRHRVE